jgi:hypothetical protein
LTINSEPLMHDPTMSLASGQSINKTEAEWKKLMTVQDNKWGTNYKLTIVFDFSTNAWSSNKLIVRRIDVKISARYNLAGDDKQTRASEYKLTHAVKWGMYRA